MKKLYVLGSLIILVILLTACTVDIPAAPQPYDLAPLESRVESGLLELSMLIDSKADKANVNLEVANISATIEDNFAIIQSQISRLRDLITCHEVRIKALEATEISLSELETLIDSKLMAADKTAYTAQLEQEVTKLEAKLVSMSNRISALESIIENFFSGN